MCTGFRWVEVLPSPKSQNHEVGDPAELSVKYTVRGTRPLLGFIVKSAVGKEATVNVVLACRLYALAWTVYVPGEVPGGTWKGILKEFHPNVLL